jgi:beta-mannosidase
MIKYFLILMIPFFSNTLNSQQILSWNLTHPISGKNYNVPLNASVQEVLIAEGELPDPFYGENENLFTWIEDYTWEFDASFTISLAQMQQDYLEMEFPCVDTYAKIYINGQLVLETDNFFLPYIISIKEVIQVGKNTIKAVFTSPINYHRETFLMRSSKLPAPNDVHKKIQIAPFSRKPQYQFGWDWALRMNTMGFLKPVSIHAYSLNRALLCKVEATDISTNSANMKLSLKTTQQDSLLKIESQLFGSLTFQREKEGLYSCFATLANPILWWPRGHGEAYLYNDTWKILNSVGKLFDTKSVSFGVRKTELIIQPDQWGTSFYVKINNKPIFAKGANYIPQDVFPSRVQEKDIRKMVEQMYLSNFNMVRIWGGGFYQEDAFYDECDKLGIMVWQDFMFACAMYPGDENFLSTVKAEVEYQAMRISAHPSLVLFNGNNEVDVAWKNWGFQMRYLIGPKMQRQIEEDYKKLFQQLIPTTVSMLTNVPYVHTSPLSNWGKDEYYSHGTQHYWGVWHGKDPIEDFGRKSGRFNAEYGFQSFPEYATLLKVSEKKDWSLDSKVMKHHQKSYVGNGMIKKHADILYGSTKSFEEFIYFSQLTQAKAVSIAVASHRIDAPRCMGTLYWQLNDCWQAPTWSSLDYYGNWKALQYTVKKDYEDVAVLSKVDKLNEERYYFLSEVDAVFESEVNYTIYNVFGKVLLSKKMNIPVSQAHLQEICVECNEKEFLNQNYVLKITWTNHLNLQLERTFYHSAKKKEKTSEKNIQISLKNVDEVNKKAIIEVETKEFLQDFWLYSMKLGVRFDKNFENLLPGKHVFTIEFTEKPQLSDFGYKFL